eukprot:UN26546
MVVQMPGQPPQTMYVLPQQTTTLPQQQQQNVNLNPQPTYGGQGNFTVYQYQRPTPGGNIVPNNNNISPNTSISNNNNNIQPNQSLISNNNPNTGYNVQPVMFTSNNIQPVGITSNDDNTNSQQ